MPYWLDGNNLIGQSAAEARRDPFTSKSFLKLLSGYARTRGGRFLVYFDGEDHGRALPPKGVRVRYSAPSSTDDAILRNLEGARSPVEIIVVTNDQRLASCCRNAGARTMDWRQFTEKMALSAKTGPNAAKEEESVDLKEWSNYFGLDPDKIK